ncbi:MULTISPECIES: Gfo/Idh/MocA family oxidoreductase [unclassified Roseitalea]|uniref:Gfo/Idh/MocA family protein n=1 Tax=unclassified Roseitalea TaxID=2639107 RepID=UPI00273E5270|nr:MULTISPECIES: Gfo/Idh/MocA family oxidoreductase [unclassified Roseitalea]
MRFAMIGTGFVADYYMTTLANHGGLTPTGAWDRDRERLGRFCAHWTLTGYETCQELLGDSRVDAVAVLTDPGSHYELAKAALDAGKHVYCEKPLALTLTEARRLVTLADARGLILAGAPANAYSSAFELTRATLDKGAIGAPKLVYAQMEDGAVFRERWRQWRSVSGAPWPGAHEFEIGCTLEHAGYALSWLIGLFGPIRRMVGHSGVFFADKGVGVPANRMGRDFSTACLFFDDGVVARLTCGLCAPKDRALTVMGDSGTLTVADLWDDRSAIHLETAGGGAGIGARIARRLEARAGRVLPFAFPAGRRLSYGVGKRRKALPGFPSQIDFSAGLAAVADCRAGRGKSRAQLAAEALHVTEAALALDGLGASGGAYAMTSEV